MTIIIDDIYTKLIEYLQISHPKFICICIQNVYKLDLKYM